tara:strand:- start:456 stop:932 length:477 start_codon:yes stop_codon:yes gene_type:complete
MEVVNMIGSDKVKVRQKIERVVMGHEWSIKEIMNLDDSLSDMLDEMYDDLSLRLVISLLDESLLKEIREDFMYNATQYAKQIVSSYLDDATVDLKTSAKLNMKEMVENDNNNTFEIDNEPIEANESEDVEVTEQVRDMIRADVKQLTVEEMKERGMVD